jgi:TonB family protein
MMASTQGRRMTKLSVFPLGLLVALVVTALLQACVVSRINPDATERANAYFENLDRTPGPSERSKHYDQLQRLWQDHPQYVRLLDIDPVKRVRMISAVAPAYPTLLRLGHVNAKVLVSFVVGTNGRVEAARILESSDSRFNDSVLEATRRFTFIPAQGTDGPTRYITQMPFNFQWDEKHHESPPPQTQ